MVDFPRRHLAALQELAGKILATRAVGSDNEVVARDLLAGFQDVCMRAGLDGLLAELDPASEPERLADLAARLGNKAEFDPRGPRTALPQQLANCLSASLSLTPIDPPEQPIPLTGELRREVAAALAGVIEVALAAPQIRETIIAMARTGFEERHLKVFEKITSQLDDRGMRGLPTPKLPLDAVQAVQRALSDARTAIVAKAANAAIDRAKDVLAKVSPEAAERIDRPISHRSTPRDVALLRIDEGRVARLPEPLVHSLLETLTEMAELQWHVPEQMVRPYTVSHTFSVGDLVEHPKFGRGTVLTSATQRIEVEFEAGIHTLVHARGNK